ncbi:hypothetical protein NQ317_016821, partial [Molorchus minor]
SRESFATIPETIRALLIFPELSLKPKPPCLVPLLIFSVRGIDFDYSRNDPSTPDFSRTLPKPKTTVESVFPYIFRSRESFATIPETIRALPIFSELSRSSKTTVFGVCSYFQVQRNRLQLFP